MAEIKSTIELAMERTKQISISEKEKEEMKQKEILQKAMGLFYRYREGRLSLNEILKEIDRMDQQTERLIKEILLSQLIDALSLTDEDERLLKGIESLKQGDLEEMNRKFYQLFSQYKSAKEKIKKEVRSKRIEALRKEKISGSAVEPNLEGNPLWEKEGGKLDRQYGGKLEAFKEQLRGYK
jgi:hypothetical protein